MEKRDRASFFFPPFLVFLVFLVFMSSYDSLRECAQRPPQSHVQSVATE